MNSTGANVLIVDADAAVVRALSRRCSKLDLKVQTAKNGLQAILRATRNPPRFIILDVELPEVDGFRVCEWLLDPKRPPVDVIVMTARTDPATVDRCDSLGAYYVPKGPGAWEMVLSILKDALNIDDRAIPAFAPSKIDKDAALWAGRDRNKVLIVDDNPELANDLAHRLEKCGAIARTAPDGIHGYRIAMKELPNVIITDYTMPRGSGHYMIWRLKSTEATKDIPIIVMSEQKGDVEKKAASAQETHGYGEPARYFHKPLDVDALFREVSRHCAIQYNDFDAPL